MDFGALGGYSISLYLNFSYKVERVAEKNCYNFGVDIGHLLPDHQWFAEWQHDLPPENVEVGRLPGAVCHNHVGHGELLGGKVQPSEWWEV